MKKRYYLIKLVAILFTSLFFDCTCLTQGTVMIVGIDTEMGSRPSNNSHGSIADWCNIINTGLLANVTNGKSDILVIGGGKNSSNDVKSFWNQVTSCLGRNVTYKHRKYLWNSVADINSISFNNYALVVIATDHSDVSGYLRKKELDALNNRKNDIADFLCRGGALFASSCEYSNPYGYLSKTGSISTFSEQYNDITPTTEGTSIGITNTNLDNGPWHIAFNSFPSYLKTLALNKNNSIAAIGGKNVSVTKVNFTLPKTTFCLADPIIADASGSIGVASYFWSIQESDATWNRFGPEISQWFTGPLTTTNLSTFASSKGFSFKCNTYYRIKLAVGGLCVNWIDTTLLIKIICPEVNAGPDKCISCSIDGNTTQLGLGNSPTLSYIWNPSTGLNNPNIGYPIHQNGSVPYPITYTVTATDNIGCSNSDKVTLFCSKPIVRLKDTTYCCGVKLYSNAENYNNISWSTGETGISEIDVHTAGTYSVTASNPCGTVTQSITVPAMSILTGFFNPIAYNSKFHPPTGGSGLKDKLYIMDVLANTGIGDYGAANIPNSYNATDYILEIWNRWGELIKTNQGYSCNGFNNWAINWDGTNQAGNLVEQGVYVWRVRFKNCQYTEWRLPNERKFVNPVCIDWFTVFGIKLWCSAWDHPGPTTVDVTINTGSVTLVQ